MKDDHAFERPKVDIRFVTHFSPSSKGICTMYEKSSYKLFIFMKKSLLQYSIYVVHYILARSSLKRFEIIEERAVHRTPVSLIISISYKKIESSGLRMSQQI